MFGIFTGNFLGLRLLDDGKGNFISIIDDDVVMSSMPLSSDVAELKRNKVMSVVNMQAEWSGPEAGYREAGIEQLVRFSSVAVFPAPRYFLSAGSALFCTTLLCHSTPSPALPPCTLHGPFSIVPSRLGQSTN